LLRNRDTEGCVQEIATRLGLPVRISLSYVPKDFRPGTSNGFRTAALAQTDWSGHGIGGITAQVSVPQSLPMFGTSGLQGFPIRVRVSESCYAHPDTFVAIMAHELSHVLLASLWSPHKDSELYTDLVPIVLGFRDAVRRGRKTINVATSGSTTTRRSTTYGYLTDAQFDFACNYVTGILEPYQSDNRRLLSLMWQLQVKLRNATSSLATFRDYFRYLDAHPPKRMTKEHAERAVQLHGHDHGLEWENRITAVRNSMESVEPFARAPIHYRASASEHLGARLRADLSVLEAASEELDNLIEAIGKDERILGKYVNVGFIRRLWRTLWRRS
ncbi:MAG: hypothetical protein Q8P50_01040, partial [Bacillota bacterium]|nr:hypothetical protein [Bacillota bacterium]